MSIKDYIISKIIRLKIVKDLHEKSKILDLIENDSRDLVVNTIELMFVELDDTTKTDLMYKESKVIYNLTSHILRAERINFIITEDLLFKTIIRHTSDKQIFNFICSNFFKEKYNFDTNLNYNYIRKEVFKRIRGISKLILNKNFV